MVSLLSRLRLMERPSVSNLLKLISRHPISQDSPYKHQRLPRLNHRQLGTPQQSPLTRDLEPSLMGSGLHPQTTKPLKRNLLSPHPLQMSPTWARTKGACGAFPALLSYNPSLNSVPVCPTGFPS